MAFTPFLGETAIRQFNRHLAYVLQLQAYS